MYVKRAKRGYTPPAVGAGAGGPPQNSARAQARPERVARVRFWGVRGSIPTPGPDTVRFGGNTSCVTLDAPDIDGGSTGKPGTIVFDAGSGIRPLGFALLREKGPPLRAHLLLSHTHWDHIQGFPFFVPAFIPGNQISVYGCTEGEGGIRGALEGQMAHRYFPVALSQLGATLDFTDVTHGEQTIGGVTVSVAPLNHSSTTVGYRVETGGRSVVYLTDAEPRRDGDHTVVDPAMLSLAAGADLLIHDAQYTDEEYPTKVGWGHSPIGYVVDFALSAAVRHLVLFHHDPLSTDQKIDAMLAGARERAAAAGAMMQVDAAAEGAEILLPLLDDAVRDEVARLDAAAARA